MSQINNSKRKKIIIVKCEINNNFIQMNQILQNSYFNTTIKHKYSFPKSDRFPEIKSNYTIDYYDSSSVQKPRSTSFGYGSKYDFYKNTKAGPSPFEYTVKDNKQLTKGLSFGASREDIKTNSYIDPEKIKTPKVGDYNGDILKLKKKQPSYRIISRHPSDSFIQPDKNPQPNKYNPIDTFYSRRRKSANFAFGSSKRFNYNQKYVIPIGPGAYSTDIKPPTKYGTFGHADRKTYAVQQIQKSISPGPKYIVK